jgi:hypothetical protein
LITLLLFASSWIIIVGAFVYEDDLRKLLDYIPYADNIASYIPPALLIFVDEITPRIISFLPNLEKWLHIKTVLHQEIWRNYLAQISNLVVYIAIQYEMIKAEPYISDIRVEPLMKYRNTAYECRED